MFIAALFTTAQIWKPPKRPSTDGWMRKRWCVCTHRHTHTHTYTYTHDGILLSPKKNEILSFAATWMRLGVIIRGEVSQTKANTT